jgi:phosphoserine phosphatase
MSRRNFIRMLGIGGAASLAPLTPALAANSKAAKPVMPILDAGRWQAGILQRIEGIILNAGNTSRSYSAQRKPYVVFDWDNTSIMNDTEEALFMYQINNLAFAMPPADFAAAITRGVPAGNFLPAYNNAAGQAVSLAAISEDLLADYTWLWQNYRGMQGKLALDEVQGNEIFIDFRAKLYYLYEAINDSYGPDVGYPWVIYLFSGLSVSQVSQLAEDSNDYGLGDALRKVKYSSPTSRPGKAGMVSVSHSHGLRLTPEIAQLMHTLRAHGIDVYVSTASLEDVVRVFASHPKYGYALPPENVIGLRLEMDGQTYRAEYRKDWPLNWGPGKSVVIRRELASKKGYGPLMVLGDSDGDYDMLRDFPDTALGVIVNRLKKGKIGSLCKLASEQAARSDARFMLQGRDERTGQWLPESGVRKIGSSETKLLA